MTHELDAVLARIAAASEGDTQPLGPQVISRLGAPFGANWSAYPSSDLILVWMIGQLARVVGVFTAANIALLLATTRLKLIAAVHPGLWQPGVLAKWLARHPSLLIVDEPTRGIDVGTKSEVHRLISSLARDGVAVLMISSELPEVLALADRVLVMREGRLAASFTRAEASEEAIVAAGTTAAVAQEAAR